MTPDQIEQLLTAFRAGKVYRTYNPHNAEHIRYGFDAASGKFYYEMEDDYQQQPTFRTPYTTEAEFVAFLAMWKQAGTSEGFAKLMANVS